MPTVFLGGEGAPRAVLENLSHREIFIVDAGDFDVAVVRECPVRVKGHHRRWSCRSCEAGWQRHKDVTSSEPSSFEVFCFFSNLLSRTGRGPVCRRASRTPLSTPRRRPG